MAAEKDLDERLQERLLRIFPSDQSSLHGPGRLSVTQLKGKVGA